MRSCGGYSVRGCCRNHGCSRWERISRHGMLPITALTPDPVWAESCTRTGYGTAHPECMGDSGERGSAERAFHHRSDCLFRGRRSHFCTYSNYHSEGGVAEGGRAPGAFGGYADRSRDAVSTRSGIYQGNELHRLSSGIRFASHRLFTIFNQMQQP